MNTLFLNPPSYAGFDGGAGSRYQAKREVRSFWYPTWLAQAAALVPESRLVDAPADELTTDDVLAIGEGFDLAVIFTSTPSFANDARLAGIIKERRPECMIGFVGPHVSVLPEESLRAAPAVDFVVRREFDLSIQQIAQGRKPAEVEGISWREGDTIRHNPDAPPIADLDALPYAVEVYRRDLNIANYYIGYLMHPYLSIYTGRGCPAHCIFCLWPQTFSGHDYRVRGVDSVCEELALAKSYFPEVREYFFDDDTFTAEPERAVEIARRIAPLGITWSASTRATVDFHTLEALKRGGLRLLMVGFESGSDEILRRARKGITTDMSRRFMRDCKSLGIAVHGTFMFGLPGETRETIEQTMRFACELDPDTMQVSIAAPYPGTRLYREAAEQGLLAGDELVSTDGTQSCALRYDDLESREILSSVDRFYKRFYFRPRVMVRIGRQMLADAEVRKRRLREGREFIGFLRRRKEPTCEA